MISKAAAHPMSSTVIFIVPLGSSSAAHCSVRGLIGLWPHLAGGRAQRAQQCIERLARDRLGQVQVEAGVQGTPPVFFLAPAAYRDERHTLGPGGGANGARHL